MCIVSDHAVTRAIERLNCRDATDAVGTVKAMFKRAEFIGSWWKDGEKVRFFVNRHHNVVLILAIDSDVVKTVWKINVVRISSDIYDQIVTGHTERLAQVDRQRTTLADHLERLRSDAQDELMAIERGIIWERNTARRIALAARREALQQTLDEYTHLLAEIDRYTEGLVKSIARIAPMVLPERTILYAV